MFNLSGMLADDMVLSAYFPQAKAFEMASKLPGKRLHTRSLINGLSHVRHSLLYVQDALAQDALVWLFIKTQLHGSSHHPPCSYRAFSTAL